MNAQQMASDYVLVPRPKMDGLVAAIEEQLGVYYPDLAEAYSSILADKYYARHKDMLKSIKGQADIRQHGEDDVKLRKLAPRLVIDPPKDALVLQEEVFGPILPIVPYDDLNEAISFVNSRPRPLAFYCFGKSKQQIRKVVH